MANTRAQQTTLIGEKITTNGNNENTGERVRDALNPFVTAAAFVDDDNTFTASNTFQDVTIFNKKVRWKKGSNLASASTLVPGTTGNTFLVTGTTTISAIQDGSAGTVIFLEFQGALTLTHSSNLILPNNGQSIVTAAGDRCVFICESSGVWRCWIYQRADGQALQPPPTIKNNIVNSLTFPTASDDSGDGYSVGSKWFAHNASASFEFVCVDASVGAAIWQLQTTISNTEITSGTVVTLSVLTQKNFIYITADLGAGTGFSIDASLAIPPNGAEFWVFYSVTQSSAPVYNGIDTPPTSNIAAGDSVAWVYLGGVYRVLKY